MPMVIITIEAYSRNLQRFFRMMTPSIILAIKDPFNKDKSWLWASIGVLHCNPLSKRTERKIMCKGIETLKLSAQLFITLTTKNIKTKLAYFLNKNIKTKKAFFPDRCLFFERLLQGHSGAFLAEFRHKNKTLYRNEQKLRQCYEITAARDDA